MHEPAQFLAGKHSNGTATDDGGKDGAHHSSSSSVFVGLASLCLAGAVILLFVRPSSDEAAQRKDPDGPGFIQRPPTVKEKSEGDGFFMLMRSSRAIWLLVPLFFFSGLNIGINHA